LARRSPPRGITWPRLWPSIRSIVRKRASPSCSIEWMVTIPPPATPRRFRPRRGAKGSRRDREGRLGLRSSVLTWMETWNAVYATGSCCCCQRHCETKLELNPAGWPLPGPRRIWPGDAALCGRRARLASRLEEGRSRSPTGRPAPASDVSRNHCFPRDPVCRLAAAIPTVVWAKPGRPAPRFLATGQPSRAVGIARPGIRDGPRRPARGVLP
jgi:hypothetical protein